MHNLHNNRELLMQATDVRIHFKDTHNPKSTIKAVDGINLSIYQNETFGIVGESGCGKSTLGKGLIDLIPLTAGTVTFRDKNIAMMSKKELKDMRKKVQIIFQDPSACLNPRRKIIDILKEPFKIHGIHDQNIVNARIAELIQLVGLAEYHLTRYPHELSGGQKQRIGIARALALQPELIICDEAVSALDVAIQAQVLNLLKELQTKLGLTYLFISHNLNVVYHVSDRVGVMYLGKMVEVASYKSLYENRFHPYTQALLSSIPQINKDQQQQRIILEGEVPNPANPPHGCPFHTRCPKAFDRCMNEIPGTFEVEQNHFVSCHLYDTQS